MKLLLSVLVAFVLFKTNAQQTTYPLLPNEKWYGGAVNDGHLMPFSPNYSINLIGDNKGNQASPLFLSNMGRYIWSDEPFQLTIGKNFLIINKAEVKIETSGNSLQSAYLAVSKIKFPPSGKMPDSLLMLVPQYNTWIELLYNQNQNDILKYAHAIINNGFLPGVLMIDDNWFSYYGDFDFRKDRFSSPATMMDELHQMGFKVMLWVSPFISPDTEVFRELNKKKFLIFDNKGMDTLQWINAREPLITKWWNGYSAQLDVTNPDAMKWLRKKLDALQYKYGVDGFKFDAGDMEFYPANMLTFTPKNANEMCELWGALGLVYPLNEYRAMWKRGGEPLAERLRDKLHTWGDLQKLIPHAVVAGLLGYPFVCPDMIGGGDYSSFIDNKKLNQDLIVRSAQCQALMPMMQFSVAPWQVLDSPRLAIVKQAVATRLHFTPYIMSLAKEAAVTGAPIVRNMEYEFPHQGFENIKTQFMLGSRYIVAPIIDTAKTKTVYLPKGVWKNWHNEIIKGPLVLKIPVDITELPYYEKIKE